MPKTPPPEGAEEQLPETLPAEEDSVLADSFYEVPAELKGAAERTQPASEVPTEPEDEEEAKRPKRPFPIGKVALLVVALAAALAVLMIFREQQRRRAVREGIAQAEKLLDLDTADGYRRAADLLAPLAQLGPLEAGSARAFALSMLAADYRDAKAETEANALLVLPGRAKALPRYAALAFAALAFGKNGLGDATSALGNAADSPWTQTLQARIALRAGTLEAAVAPSGAGNWVKEGGVGWPLSPRLSRHRRGLYSAAPYGAWASW